jgi:hypothetical protein
MTSEQLLIKEPFRIEAIEVLAIVFQLTHMLVSKMHSLFAYRSCEIKKASNMENKCLNTNDIEIRTKAEAIMTNGDPIGYIIEQHQRMHIGDGRVALTLLLSIALQSVLNSKGIQPKVSGESGKGKTHCCQAMAHLVPDEWVLETTLSDRVIYRLGLKPGRIILSDDVDDLSPSLEGTIKRATTNFQKETVYNTLNKEHEVNKLSIPPRIVWWLTSVDDNQSLQLLNRQFSSGVDESSEQDQKVLEHQMEQAMTGRVDLHETDEVHICRRIIGDIKEQTFTVIIPFADKIEWPNAANRRNFDMFLDMIRGCAVLRYKQRKTDETGALIAKIEDFESAAELYNSRARSQQSKTTTSENRLLDALVKLGFEATYEDLCSELNLSQGRISQLLTGKEKGHDSGLLHKIPELTVDTIGQKRLIRLNKSYKQNNYEVRLKHKEEE